MDLNTVVDVLRPRSREGLADWRAGDAWLGGGTWLFSEPQPAVHRLLDLDGLGWAPLEVGEQGLTLAATCRIADLYALTAPPDWLAAPLIRQCCRALLASFKIWNAATVGGNLCMSLPAGAMISLTTALHGTCVIWPREGGERRVPVEEFVTGLQQNVLAPGDVLRAIELPAAALRARTSFRQCSLTRYGRSAALLIGTRGVEPGDFALTVTAATERPLRLEFATLPTESELHARLAEAIPDPLYFDDVHGTPAYRKHMTYLFAEQIRRELADGAGQ
ncbi:MAG TPA: FAD binding domain-containing protein [Chloroflexota bacterium]|jgi:CO/xanthine dehydrogenase FAD-binding subunit